MERIYWHARAYKLICGHNEAPPKGVDFGNLESWKGKMLFCNFCNEEKEVNMEAQVSGEYESHELPYAKRNLKP